VLLVSSLFAAAGLYFLSGAQGVYILIFATVYGIGQCFFWPVTLGVVAEQFPRGGALTLNAIAGVGMLGVGIVGMQVLGFWQDTYIDANLKTQPEVYARLMEDEERLSVFGNYRALDVANESKVMSLTNLHRYRAEAAAGTDDPAQLDTTLADDKEYQVLVQTAFNQGVRTEAHPKDVPFEQMLSELAGAGLLSADTMPALEQDRAVIEEVRTDSKRNAMAKVTTLPLIMAVCYLLLILYYRSKGGYKVEQLPPASA
jgi:hypothetical protein